MDKCIIFCRVSTDRQELDEQELKASALAVSDGYSPEQQILISYKESGIRLTEEARMGLTDMKERITKDASIKAVYAFEISRIARSQKVLYSVRDFLIEHHVQLCIVQPIMTALDALDHVDSLNQQELYTLVHEQVKEIRLDIRPDGKMIEVRSFYSEKAVFLFTGQARAFKLYRIYDGEMMDVTEVSGFRDK